MVSRISLLGLLIICHLGCSKASGPSTPEEPTPQPPPPGALTYNLKIRNSQEGDRATVIRSRKGTSTQNFAGKVTTRKLDYQYEFTETVERIAAGLPKPAKITRTYSTAWKVPNDGVGAVATHSYSGKTVVIERPENADSYRYLIDGMAISGRDLDEFQREFDKVQRADIRVLLPEKPVAVGESWAPDFAQTVRAVFGSLPFEADPQKSKATGTLKSVDRKDGQLWGTIDVKTTYYFADKPQYAGLVLTEPQIADVTIHAVVDGSANTLKTTMKNTGTITMNDPRVGQVKVMVDVAEEETRTPQK